MVLSVVLSELVFDEDLLQAAKKISCSKMDNKKMAEIAFLQTFIDGKKNDGIIFPSRLSPQFYAQTYL